jgi:D-alanine-D-alanine ligase
MYSGNQRVVVLHNMPRSGAREPGFLWYESDAGIMSEVERVTGTLQELGVPYHTVGIRQLSDLKRYLAGTTDRLIFNLVEGLQGCERGIDLVPTIVRSFNKGCTGSDSECLALCLDKGRTKMVLRAAGVPTPRAICVPVGRTACLETLPHQRLIVKPLRADGSEGIDSESVVEGPGRDLEKAVRRVHGQFAQPALVERFIAGREVNVSIVQHGDELQVLPLAEIEFSAFPEDKPYILDFAAKWLPGTFQFENTHRKIPAELPSTTAVEIRRLALIAWKATGCEDYARVDFRIDHEGHPFVLEVNPNPDIGADSGFAAALEAAEISYARFIYQRLSAAHDRHLG